MSGADPIEGNDQVEGGSASGPAAVAVPSAPARTAAEPTPVADLIAAAVRRISEAAAASSPPLPDAPARLEAGSAASPSVAAQIASAAAAIAAASQTDDSARNVPPPRPALDIAPVVFSSSAVADGSARPVELTLEPQPQREPEAEPEPVPVLEPETQFGPDPQPRADAPDSGSEPLAYVPVAADRAAISLPAAPIERIEPVFERPVQRVDLDGSRELSVPIVTALTPPDRVQPRLVAQTAAAVTAGIPTDSAPVSAPVQPSATVVPVRGPWLRAARIAGLVVGGYFAAVLALIVLYRVINPPASTLMLYQTLTGTDVRQTWAPIEDISPNLLRAVIVSEDWGFCKHFGVDLDAIEQALEKAGDGIPRGASTISMQVTKNLFLTQSKSYIRKAIEIPLTMVSEFVWPKSRMLEIYLNIAEWGPGVFGAEEAARHHFSKSAAQLSEREAALLAASLPNPMIRDAGDPGPRTARKASVIQSRMRAAGPVADCAMPPRKPQKASGGWQTNVKKRAGAEPSL